MSSTYSKPLSSSPVGPVDGLSAATDPLTDVVCWSRMQTESGETLGSIVSRKELERRTGNGLFYWGVGSAPARITSRFAISHIPVDVVFSIMRSKPRNIDVRPSSVLIWRGFLDGEGNRRRLPTGVLITSRGRTGERPKQKHYALVCMSDHPLVIRDLGPFDDTAYRNAGVMGAGIGASQVTALLQFHGATHKPARYRVNLRARLTDGYWVRLVDPIVADDEKRTVLAQLASPTGLSTFDWSRIVDQLRSGSSPEDSLFNIRPTLL